MAEGFDPNRIVGFTGEVDADAQGATSAGTFGEDDGGFTNGAEDGDEVKKVEDDAGPREEYPNGEC